MVGKGVKAILVAIAALVAALSAIPASAQIYWPPPFQTNQARAQLEPMQRDLQQRERRLHDMQNSPNTRNEPVQTPSPIPADSSSFAVAADPAVTARMRQLFFSTVAANNSPDVAASITRTFENKPVRAAYLEAASPYGLGANDLRDVMTAYMVVAWMVANQAPLPTHAQVQGLRSQMIAAWAQSPQASDAVQRQQLAEQMMYQLVSFIYARQEGAAKNDRAGLSRMADEVEAHFRDQQNMDLRQMALTDSGFEPR